MVIRGRVQNGVIVLEDDVNLPEGTEVSVVVPQAAEQGVERLSEDERWRIKAILDRLASLPDENPGDTFSGADHDSVLYGES